MRNLFAIAPRRQVHVSLVAAQNGTVQVTITGRATVTLRRADVGPYLAAQGVAPGHAVHCQGRSGRLSIRRAGDYINAV
jgi:hypothetical protein